MLWYFLFQKYPHFQRFYLYIDVFWNLYFWCENKMTEQKKYKKVHNPFLFPVCFVFSLSPVCFFFDFRCRNCTFKSEILCFCNSTIFHAFIFIQQGICFSSIFSPTYYCWIRFQMVPFAWAGSQLICIKCTFELVHICHMLEFDQTKKVL